MSSTIDRQPVGDVSPAYVLAVNRRTPRFSRSVGRQHAEPLGRSVGQGAAVGTAAELPRTTSCTGYGAGLAASSPRTEARTRAPTGAPLTAGPYPAGPPPRSAAETPPAHCTDDTRRWAAVAESILPLTPPDRRPRREIAPRAVHVPAWLSIEQQRRLVVACRGWAA